MFMLIILVAVTILCLNVSADQFVWNSLSKYDHFVKRPAMNLRTGGRLTNRQIGYISVAGYKSVLSISNFTSDDSTFQGVDGEFPSTENQMLIGQSYGLQMKQFTAQFSTKDSLVVSDIINSLAKPVYIHCHEGFMATFYTLLHLYQAGALPAESIFSEGLMLGWDYQTIGDAVAIVNELTGLAFTATPPAIEKLLTNGESSYFEYFWPHWVANDLWFNQGQPLQTHVSTIAAQGYKTAISFRNNGEPTLRLPSEPATGAVDNAEFSDSNGLYDVAMEQKAFESAGVKFVNLPVTGTDSWSAATFFKFLPVLDAVNSPTNGPVLAHCASGYRSTGYVVAYLAYTQKKCTPWALQQAARIGFSLNVQPSDAAVVQFFQDVLKC